MHSFMYMCLFPVLVWDSELPTIHPIASGYDVANSSTASLCCSVSMTFCNAAINLSNHRVCGGMKSEQVFVFYWSSPILHVNFLRMSIQKYSLFKSLESNAKLHHLALSTMLSALKHDLGMLALFVVVSQSQPNHTCIPVYIRNEVRAVVTDD